MTELQALNAIYARWIEGWAALHPSDPDDPNFAPYALKNETFSTEELGLLGAWARVTIRWSQAPQTTQGGPDVRTYEPSGFIFVDLFAPINAGVTTLAQLSDDARVTLRGKRLGDTELCIYEGESRNGPDAANWATQSVVFRFSFEQLG